MHAWDKFLAVLEASLGKEIVDNWLRPLKVVRFDACNLYLEAADTFQMMWFEEHIRPKLKQTLLNYNQAPIKVHLSVGALKQVPVKRKQGKDAAAKSVEAPNSSFEITFDYPNKTCTLQNFVVSESNLLSHNLLTELCHSVNGSSGEKKHVQPGTYNPIYIYGESGSGKTHLLAATAHALMAAGLRVIYARAETFTDHVVNAIRAGEMHLFRQAYRNTDVLLLDDVQIFGRKAATQEELFHTFNTLHMAGKQIILSADKPPQELQHIEPRLISRFEWGIVVETGSLSDRELKLLIQNKCAALDYPLNPRTVDYLVETFSSSPKSLVKALEALVLRTHIAPGIHTHVSSTALSVNQARLYLNDLVKAEEKLVITPEKIIKQTAEHFDIKVEDILGKSQSRECSLPRQLAAYLCRDLLKMPYKKIGDLFDRDHSTIMTSVKQIQKLLEDPVNEIAAPLRLIQSSLKSSQSPEENPVHAEV